MWNTVTLYIYKHKECNTSKTQILLKLCELTIIHLFSHNQRGSVNQKVYLTPCAIMCSVFIKPWHQFITDGKYISYTKTLDCITILWWWRFASNDTESWQRKHPNKRTAHFRFAVQQGGKNRHLLLDDTATSWKNSFLLFEKYLMSHTLYLFTKSVLRKGNFSHPLFSRELSIKTRYPAHDDTKKF